LTVEQVLDRLVAVNSRCGRLFHRHRDCRQGVVLEQHQDPDILPGAALLARDPAHKIMAGKAPESAPGLAADAVPL